MMSQRNRWIVVALFGAIVAGVASAVQHDGEVRPVGARLNVAILDSASWYAPPIIAARDDDPQGVYVVAPEMPKGAEFAAVRVDTRTQEQTRTTVTLDPHSAFHAFSPATSLQTQVRGVRFRRPAIHLLSFPGGGGPGMHRIDSATGSLSVWSGSRLLLTRDVFNSSNTAELLSLITSDRNGRWLAALTRGDDGWRLFLYAPLLED